MTGPTRAMALIGQECAAWTKLIYVSVGRSDRDRDREIIFSIVNQFHQVGITPCLISSQMCHAEIKRAWLDSRQMHILYTERGRGAYCFAFAVLYFWLRQGHVLQQKFQDEELRQMLLATENAFLLEHNPKHGRDTVFGFQSTWTILFGIANGDLV